MSVSFLIRCVPPASWRVLSTSSSSKLVRSQLCFRHICRLFQCSRKHAATRSYTNQKHHNRPVKNITHCILTPHDYSESQHTTTPQLVTTILLWGFNLNSQVGELHRYIQHARTPQRHEYCKEHSSSIVEKVRCSGQGAHRAQMPVVTHSVTQWTHSDVQAVVTRLLAEI